MIKALTSERSGGRSVERWAEGPTIVASIWRYRWMVLAVAVLAGLAGLFLSRAQPPVYEASTRLFLTSPGTAGVFERQASVPLERYMPQQQQLSTSAPVLTAAAEALEGDDITPRELADQVEATTNLELVTLTITVVDGSPERAADIANAVAVSYEDAVRTQQLARVNRAVSELEQTVEAIEEQIDELAAGSNESGELPPGQAGQIGILTQRLVEVETLSQQLLVDARLFGSGVEFVEPAEPPLTPISPRPNRTAVISALLAAMLASAVAYWLAGRARPVVSRDDPAEILGVPLLGVLPTYRVPEVGTLAQRASLEPRTSEAYRFVYSSLIAILDEQQANSVMFTSASPGAGKTETALQIALTAARRGKRTLLIDADLRMRALSQFLRAERIPGLADLGEASSERHADSLILPYEIDEGRHLGILTAGRVIDPSGDHLSESWFGHAFAEAVSDFDLAVVDSPPLLAVADTATIAGYSDAIVLVVREGSDLDELERVRDRLRFVRQRLVGYVYVSPAALSDTTFDYGLSPKRGWGEINRPKSLLNKQKQGGNGTKSDEAADVYQRWFGAQGPPPSPTKDAPPTPRKPGS
jgi:Mrp family chromosome partitioning ATPase